jgi:hypothetical protein
MTKECAVRRSLVSVLAAWLACVSFAALPSEAVTIELRSLGQLSRAAERITHGRIVAERVEEDDQGLYWTTYTLLVEEELKDSSIPAGSTFEFRQLGGTLDGETLLAVGFPYFAVGEECLLFLHGDGVAQRVLNAWQGAVRITETPSLQGGPPVLETLGLAGQFPDAASSELASFKTAVRGALAGVRP